MSKLAQWREQGTGLLGLYTPLPCSSWHRIMHVMHVDLSKGCYIKRKEANPSSSLNKKQSPNNVVIYRFPTSILQLPYLVGQYPSLSPLAQFIHHYQDLHSDQCL